MVEVLGEVLEAEKKAKSIAEDAEKRKEQIISSANQKAAKLIEDKEKELLAEKEKRIKEMAFEMQKKKKEIVSENKKEMEKLRKVSQKNIDKAVDFILKKFGYIPYTYDSHFGEYISWAWEKADIEGVRAFYEGYKILTLTTGEKLRKLIKRGKGSRIVKPDVERAIPIIEGIITDSNHEEASVNLSNDDVITNLHQDLVVECPAIVNKHGVKAIKLGDYPKGLAALLRNEASVQDLVVEAILKKSKEIAFQALLLDPTINNASKAKEIFDEMIKINEGYIILD